MIDGNSLLNRAYYAMSVFTTKDGLPTNGIFGFIKLVFKIIEEKKPKYFAVTFDLHAPTFRHKMYDGYKATRKPMPEELVKQVPVLKNLLASMHIKTAEKEGYEADDLLGTLSRKFGSVETYIYTGDRDAYQLVKENVNVCFTKRGVSDVDLLTNDNFFEKIGLTPAQIIEEKALMGDSSDNIPGVKGIGPKSALELLQAYGTVENIYRDLDRLSPATQKKLAENEANAKLSKTLATIDCNVPLDIALEDCLLQTPFSEEARKFFARLEFRSLVDSDFFAKERDSAVEITVCKSAEEVLPLLNDVKEFSFCLEKDGAHLYFDAKEFIFPLRENFLDVGFFPEELKGVFSALFASDRRALVPDVKSVTRFLSQLGVGITCEMQDVLLLRYLGDSNLRPSDSREFAKDFALPESNCAYGLKLAYDAAVKKTAGTPEEKLYRELELPLAYVLLDMENTGVAVDMEKFPVFSEKFNKELDALSKEIFDLAGVRSFNLNSPFQLSEILFEKLGYDATGVKKNLRGGYSTSADVLEKLAEKHEIARLILKYREIQKLLSTYIDGFRPLIKGGIVHTTYNQTMTTTGRLSSANPNLQNIPVRKENGRELRKLFIARQGNILVDADYSQIELRLLAHFSGCKPLVEAYNNGDDIHAATAAQVFGVPIEKVTPDQRRRAKTVNFGIIYGMSAFGLSKDLNCSTTEAQSLIDSYFRHYSDVKEYMDENVRKAKEEGFVTTILGRKRYIPELRAFSHNVRAFGERAAMNMPLQGSSADIIKIAMLRVSERLKKDGMQSKLVLQVHDELVLDAPAEEKEAAERVLKEEMEQAVTLKVPLVADVSEGKSWYDAK